MIALSLSVCMCVYVFKLPCVCIYVSSLQQEIGSRTQEIDPGRQEMQGYSRLPVGQGHKSK